MLQRAGPLALVAMLAGSCAWIARVSEGTGGFQAQAGSDAPSISADGRFVAFESAAPNLVPGDTNGYIDIFIRDTLLETTSRVSVASDGSQANNRSLSPSISADGRFVAFESLATNLDAGNLEQSDVFVRDTLLGSTTLASVYEPGGSNNGASYDPSISADGRYVAFESSSRLVPGKTSAYRDIFVRDTELETTTWVSMDAAGGDADSSSEDPSISGDGRYVAFTSFASDLVAGDTGNSDVFLRDTTLNTTERLSVTPAGGQTNGDSAAASVSADGSFVAFESGASDLVAGDTNGSVDVFVRDTAADVTTRISVDTAGTQSNGNATSPSISADGRFVGFESDANDLIDDDTNPRADVYVRDRASPSTVRVSEGAVGAQGNTGSFSPAISGDGRYVAFASDASNLIEDDTNSVTDIYVKANPLATITAVTPGELAPGSSARVIIEGVGFTDAASVTISGDGLSVSAPIVVGATRVEVDVTVSAAATPEARTVSIVQPGTGPGANAGTTGVCIGCLAVVDPLLFCADDMAPVDYRTFIESLTGTAFDDLTLRIGTDGDDTVDVVNPDELFCGGPGSDTVYENRGVFDGGPDADHVIGEVQVTEGNVGVFIGRSGDDTTDCGAGGFFGLPNSGAFYGGPGDDVAMCGNAGFFDGGDGNDGVAEGWGTPTGYGQGGDFNGGPGNDWAFENWGSFYGGEDDDGVSNNGGVFIGGPGNDSVVEEPRQGANVGGYFDGGEGNDHAELWYYGGDFDGGPGDDTVSDLASGTFNGDEGNDSITYSNSGTFNGGNGNDTVGTNNGTFNGDNDDDTVDTNNGNFDGGDGFDEVLVSNTGTCTNVEAGC